MDLDLAGRVAVVTGASSGIGRAIARCLAGEGARLALVARNEQRLTQTAAEIAAEGFATPSVYPTDLTSTAELDRTVRRVVTDHGGIDILASSAGGRVDAGLDAGEELWEAARAVNFDAQRRLVQRVVPIMRAAGFGRIVFVTGKSEPQVASGTFAAKSAMHAFAKGLSRELGRFGITVNSLAPGRVLTPPMRRHYDQDARAAQIREIPIGRYGDPVDVARMAAFLCSPDSDFVSGAVIPIDGGMRWHQL
ncbi:MAG: SDR family oxidoreductase [Nocardioides sp.]|uniref:SDR family NAD(P)-dependent oxidoreductase n=1 Tax=Nocardioides sp. TaxID=35761 RepID=UPI0039E5ECB4